MRKTNPDKGIFNKNRVEMLTDGVFAISMTLLVTGLNIPNIGGIITNVTVDSVIMSLLPDFIHYILAFILLANFWWAHHVRSYYVSSYDRRMIFLNIVTLAFVGLLPFSTNMIGDFPFSSHAAIIFELNLLFLGLLSVLQWNRVLKNKIYLNEGIEISDIILDREDAFIFPVLSLMGILLAVMAIPWSAFIYLIAPVYMAFSKWRGIRSLKEHTKPM
jgi:uncharacterized membrane protein